MIKKQQKWIALLVVCTFIWLLQVSTMPVAAANGPERISSASAEQGPDYYESVSQKAVVAKKKSILPFILIGLGLITVTAVVLVVLLISKYDITGSWQMTYTWAGETPGTVTLTFTGDKKSGTFISSSGGSGNYSVDSKNVTWTYSAYGARYTGTFTDKKNISGTMVSGSGTMTGTWFAIKNSSAASYNSPMAASAQRSMNDDKK
jgi:hypothetical protein